MVKKVDYDSFGNIINDNDPSFTIHFGFAGGLYDHDIGLVRFGFRDYDPYIGRWTAKDPILFEGGDTDLYGYCLNNPINYIDITGLVCFSWTTKDIRFDTRTAYTPWKETMRCLVQTIQIGFLVDLLTFDIRTYSVRERTGRMEWNIITTTIKHTMCIKFCPQFFSYTKSPINDKITDKGSQMWREEYWDLLSRKWFTGPDFRGLSSGLSFSFHGSTTCIPTP